MAGPSVEKNLTKIKTRVAAAAQACGRDPASINILAVCKLQPLSKIREAFECGQREFAENYLQEALPKIEQLQSLPVRWHFVGRLQSNKIKHLADHFAVIHSVDRTSVAEALNRLPYPTRQDIFLQYNVAAEVSKGGAGEVELRELYQFVVQSCPRLRILGLMAMPPLGENSHLYFRKTREMLSALRGLLSKDQLALHPMDQLSMGTSQDYEAAIAEGATWIRIGTDLFGPREEKE